MGLVVLAVGWACVGRLDAEAPVRSGHTNLSPIRRLGTVLGAGEVITRPGRVCMDNRDRLSLLAIYYRRFTFICTSLPTRTRTPANPRCCFNRRQFTIAMYVPRTGHVLTSDSPGGPKVLGSSVLGTVYLVYASCRPLTSTTSATPRPAWLAQHFDQFTLHGPFT